MRKYLMLLLFCVIATEVLGQASGVEPPHIYEKRKVQQNVLTHGAPIDSADGSINAALDTAIVKAGDTGTVYIPGGNYIVDAPILISVSNLTIRGVGPATVLIFKDHSDYLQVQAGAHNLTIKDMKFIGIDDVGDTNKSITFINANGSDSITGAGSIDNLTLENLVFDSGHYQVGLVYCKNLTVKNCDFSGSPKSLALTSCYYSSISNNRVHDYTPAGADASGLGWGILVSGCGWTKIDYNTVRNIDWSHQTGSGGGGLVVNNGSFEFEVLGGHYSYNVNGGGLEITDRSYGGNIVGVQANYNYSVAGAGAVTNNGDGIDFYNVWDMNVTGCQFIGNATYPGTLFQGVEIFNCDNVSISNCVSTNNGQDAYLVHASQNIFLSNCVGNKNYSHGVEARDMTSTVTVAPDGTDGSIVTYSSGTALPKGYKKGVIVNIDGTDYVYHSYIGANSFRIQEPSITEAAPVSMYVAVSNLRIIGGDYSDNNEPLNDTAVVDSVGSGIDLNNNTNNVIIAGVRATDTDIDSAKTQRWGIRTDNAATHSAWGNYMTGNATGTMSDPVGNSFGVQLPGYALPWLDGATSGFVMKTNASGVISWASTPTNDTINGLIDAKIGRGNGVYGELYVDEATHDTTLVVSAGTYYIISAYGGNDTLHTGDTASVVVIPDSGRLVIQVSGMYHVCALGSFQHNDAQSATVELALFKNDDGSPAKQEDLEVHRDLSVQAAVGAGGFAGLISLTAGDTLDLRVTSTEANDRIDFRTLNFGVSMVQLYGADWILRGDSLFSIDDDGDTVLVIWDDNAGNVRIQTAQEDQDLSMYIDDTLAIAGGISIGSDFIDEFAGDGLVVDGTTKDLNVSGVDSQNIAAAGIAEEELDIGNAPTGLDGYVLSLVEATGDFLWVALSALIQFSEADDNDTSTFTAINSNTVIGFTQDVTLQGNNITGADEIRGDSIWAESLYVVRNIVAGQSITGGEIVSTNLVVAAVGFDGLGAVDLDYGSGDITDHTFITDGTGTAEIVLPDESIDGTEILDATITTDDMGSNSVDSDELVNGSVDGGHLAVNVVDSTKVTANSLSVTGDLHAATSAELAGVISDETGTGVLVFGTSPTFTTGITVPDNSISDEELDEGGSFTWTAVHDFGGATSMEVPNGANTTTNAEGEIAWDADDDAIEVYSGDEGESVLIPIYQHLSIPLVLPDSIQAQAPNLIVFKANALKYPHGIEIDLVSIQLAADLAYTMVIEEWSGADPPVLENIISTVTTGGTDTYAEEAPDNDAVVDVGDRIVLNIPTTDVPVVTVEIFFHVTEGD